MGTFLISVFIKTDIETKNYFTMSVLCKSDIDPTKFYIKNVGRHIFWSICAQKQKWRHNFWSLGAQKGNSRQNPSPPYSLP